MDKIKEQKIREKVRDNIKDFVESGKNLLIYSEHTGNGKTEWLKKLLLAYFDSIWPFTDIECRGLFISMPKFISAMKANISKEEVTVSKVETTALEVPKLKKSYLIAKKIRIAFYKMITAIPKVFSGEFKKKAAKE